MKILKLLMGNLIKIIIMVTQYQLMKLKVLVTKIINQLHWKQVKVMKV